MAHVSANLKDVLVDATGTRCQFLPASGYVEARTKMDLATWDDGGASVLRLTVGGGRLGLVEWLGCRPAIQQLVSNPLAKAVADLRNGGGEHCCPILSIITATVFFYTLLLLHNILELLLSCPRIRGGQHVCVNQRRSVETATGKSQFIKKKASFFYQRVSPPTPWARAPRPPPPGPAPVTISLH